MMVDSGADELNPQGFIRSRSNTSYMSSKDFSQGFQLWSRNRTEYINIYILICIEYALICIRQKEVE